MPERQRIPAGVHNWNGVDPQRHRDGADGEFGRNQYTATCDEHHENRTGVLPHDQTGGAAVTPYFEQDGVTLYHGDCREILAGLPDESVHAIVNTFQIRRTR